MQIGDLLKFSVLEVVCGSDKGWVGVDNPGLGIQLFIILTLKMMAQDPSQLQQRSKTLNEASSPSLLGMGLGFITSDPMGTPGASMPVKEGKTPNQPSVVSQPSALTAAPDPENVTLQRMKQIVASIPAVYLESHSYRVWRRAVLN